MSSALGTPSVLKRGERLPWVIVLAGLAIMYTPTYLHAAATIWRSQEFEHAPLVLVLALGVLWSKRDQISASCPTPMSAAIGWALLVAGLLAYVAGRAFDVSSVEFVSHIPIVAALILLLQGLRALQAAWFGVIYLVFLVPLPASLIDAVTGPLKLAISNVVVDLLHQWSYPIARSGVIISVGPYQLLVADACSGLNSMVALTALGTLFIYLAARRSVVHNLLMLAAILPVAFVANLVRVVALVLVTYHLGDEAGQGFLHGAAGVFLMLMALALLFALDATLVWARAAAVPKAPRAG